MDVSSPLTSVSSKQNCKKHIPRQPHFPNSSDCHLELVSIFSQKQILTFSASCPSVRISIGRGFSSCSINSACEPNIRIEKRYHQHDQKHMKGRHTNANFLTRTYQICKVLPNHHVTTNTSIVMEHLTEHNPTCSKIQLKHITIKAVRYHGLKYVPG